MSYFHNKKIYVNVNCRELWPLTGDRVTDNPRVTFLGTPIITMIIMTKVGSGGYDTMNSWGGPYIGIRYRQIPGISPLGLA